MSVFRAQTMALYLLVLSALGTVFTADAFEWPLALGIFVATCASLVLPYRLRARWAKSRFVIVALLLLLASVVSEVWLGDRDIISGATLFLVLVLVSRLYTPRTSSDAIQVLTLSFVVVLAGSALNTSFAFAPYFVLVIVCSIWALTTTHLTKAAEAQPARARDLQISRRFWVSTSLLAIVIFLQTTAFFVVFPRMGFGYFKPKVRTSSSAAGFSDRVELGQSGELRDDATVVARIEFPEGLGGVRPEELYFRGATLGMFDGTRWTRAARGQQMVRHLADGTFETRSLAQEAKLHFTYYQEPGESEYIFLPETTPVARLLQDNPLWSGRPRVRFYTDNTGDLLVLRPIGLALHMEGWLLPQMPSTTAPTPETLALPELDPRIAKTAAEWRGDALDADEIAARLSAGLQRGFSYSATMVAPANESTPLAFFLFERKAGHCEYFASALAVMLRQSGVHARIVTGYRGASLNPFGGYYALQEYRAHSWVEYYVAERGWVRSDPTPQASAHDDSAALERVWAFLDVMRFRWNRYIVEYDLDVQVDAMRALRKQWRGGEAASPDREKWLFGKGAKYAIIAGACLALLFVLRLARRYARPTASRQMRATTLFRRLERTLQRRGVRQRPQSESALQYVQAAARFDAALAPSLEAFAQAYLRARFSPNIDAADLERMARSLNAVASAPRRHDGAAEVR